MQGIPNTNIPGVHLPRDCNSNKIQPNTPYDSILLGEDRYLLCWFRYNRDSSVILTRLGLYLVHESAYVFYKTRPDIPFVNSSGDCFLREIDNRHQMDFLERLGSQGSRAENGKSACTVPVLSDDGVVAVTTNVNIALPPAFPHAFWLDDSHHLKPALLANRFIQDVPPQTIGLRVVKSYRVYTFGDGVTVPPLDTLPHQHDAMDAYFEYISHHPIQRPRVHTETDTSNATDMITSRPHMRDVCVEITDTIRKEHRGRRDRSSSRIKPKGEPDLSRRLHCQSTTKGREPHKYTRKTRDL